MTVPSYDCDPFSREVCKGIYRTFRFLYEWEAYAEQEITRVQPLEEGEVPNQSKLEIWRLLEPDSEMETGNKGYVPNGEYVCKLCGIELPNTYVECVGCCELGVSDAAVYCYKCYQTDGNVQFSVPTKDGGKDQDDLATTRLHAPRGMGWSKRSHPDCHEKLCRSLCFVCKKCVFCKAGCNCHCRYRLRYRQFTFQTLKSMMSELKKIYFDDK